MCYLYTYSFIIPHHNSPDLLKRCIDSIPKRNDIQIIVVDDNSDVSGKPELVRDDVQVIYISAKDSRWAGHARNVGLSNATGKWLLFADCDDFYKDGFIDVLDKYKDSQLDVLYFNADSVDSVTLEPANRTKRLNEYILRYLTRSECLDEIKYRFRTPWFKMYNHDFVKCYKICFEELQKGNDIQFSFLTSFFAQKIKVIPDILYVCTYSENSMTYQKRSVDSHLCSYRNVIYTNCFYMAIGHHEWKQRVSRLLYLILKDDGICKFIKVIFVILFNRSKIHKGKRKYIELTFEKI